MEVIDDCTVFFLDILRQTGRNSSKKKHVEIKFLELSLSTIPPNLVLKLNSRTDSVVLNSSPCNPVRSCMEGVLCT
jgi:hypothetical protein